MSSPKTKTEAWKKTMQSPSAKSEVKNVFLGSKPTESYKKVANKLSSELLKASRSSSPKRKPSRLSPKRKSSSPRRGKSSLSPRRR